MGMQMEPHSQDTLCNFLALGPWSCRGSLSQFRPLRTGNLQTVPDHSQTDSNNCPSTCPGYRRVSSHCFSSLVPSAENHPGIPCWHQRPLCVCWTHRQRRASQHPSWAVSSQPQERMTLFLPHALLCAGNTDCAAGSCSASPSSLSLFRVKHSLCDGTGNRSWEGPALFPYSLLPRLPDSHANVCTNNHPGLPAVVRPRPTGHFWIAACTQWGLKPQPSLNQFLPRKEIFTLKWPSRLAYCLLIKYVFVRSFTPEICNVLLILSWCDNHFWVIRGLLHHFIQDTKESVLEFLEPVRYSDHINHMWIIPT